MVVVSKEVINTEIDVAQRLLKKWQEKLAQGYPGQDFPAEDFNADLFAREMVAEFLIIAGEMETLANVIAEGNQ